MMRYALVTGVDGFIGHKLAFALINKGYYVYGVGLSQERLNDLPNDRFMFLKAYFEDYPFLKHKLPLNKIDVFYHFAWNGVFGSSFKDYSLQISNCKHACDALMLACELRCRKFVLASTVNTLETRKYMSMNQIEPRYTNIYSMTKLCSEMMCKTLAYQNGIEFNCGIIAMVYGENNSSNMIPNVVIRNLIQNKETSLVPSDTVYDLIYVDDVASAFVAIGERGKNQKTYYVGHQKLSSFGELFGRIRDIVEPNGVLNFGVYPDTTLIDYSLVDLNALKNDTGFEPTSNFDETIIKTADWLKKTL